MEISQIRYFRAVVQYGSFTRAAEQLHITQPALSKSIAKLEAELGAPLFERKGARVTLTPAGQVLLPYCGSMLNIMDSGVQAFRESIGLRTGQLTIAVSTDIFIKPLILEFLRRSPEVSLTCHLMSQEEMAHALNEGMLDFAVSDQPVIGADIRFQVLHRGQLTAVLHAQDPLLDQSSISLIDLREHWFCIGHLRPGQRSGILKLCADAGFQPKIRYLGYDPDMAGMLTELPGSVIISSDAIDGGIRTTDISQGKRPAVPIRGTQGQSIVGIAKRDGHYQSQAALAFYDLISGYYRSINGKP